jgi:hypothetical protein
VVTLSLHPQELCDTLSLEVATVVFQMAGGVGEPPKLG